MSLVFARISDRLQRRKVFLVGGGAATSVLLGLFVLLMGSGVEAPRGILVVLLVGVGVALGAIFGPWMASFSEFVEEVHPDAQGLAFGFNHFFTKIFIFASVLLAPRVVAVGDWQTWMVVTLAATVLFTVLSAGVRGAKGRSATGRGTPAATELAGASSVAAKPR